MKRLVEKKIMGIVTILLMSLLVFQASFTWQADKQKEYKYLKRFQQEYPTWPDSVTNIVLPDWSEYLSPAVKPEVNFPISSKNITDDSLALIVLRNCEDFRNFLDNLNTHEIIVVMAFDFNTMTAYLEWAKTILNPEQISRAKDVAADLYGWAAVKVYLSINKKNGLGRTEAKKTMKYNKASVINKIRLPMLSNLAIEMFHFESKKAIKYLRMTLCFIEKNKDKYDINKREDVCRQVYKDIDRINKGH